MAFNIGYALSNGLSRFSGWRYDLPADWVVYFYFGLGFAEFLFWLASAFGAQKTRLYSFVERSDQKHQAPTLAWLAYACLFITIGATPWLAKGVFPRHFSERTAESIQAELISKPEMEGMADQLQTFVEQPDSVVMEGRLLYPRFFWRNSGLTSSNPWASYALRDYPRLGFLLLNQNVREIVLPYRGRLIQNLHAQDVQLAGCQRENYIEARLVAIPGENLVYLSSFGWEPCSP
jgi:hypothetical protein